MGIKSCITLGSGGKFSKETQVQSTELKKGILNKGGGRGGGGARWAACWKVENVFFFIFTA
jgi:hypothetical protein